MSLTGISLPPSCPFVGLPKSTHFDQWQKHLEGNVFEMVVVIALVVGTVVVLTLVEELCKARVNAAGRDVLTQSR